MEFTTPSEKTRTYTNPSPIQASQKIKRNPLIVGLKNISGTPIPFLFGLFCLSIFSSVLATQILALAISVLGFVYILIDRFGKQHEFSFFPLGTDIPFLLFLVFSVASPAFNSSSEIISSLDFLASFLFLYFSTYCFNLFPGLNRNFNILLMAALATSLIGISQYYGFIFNIDYLNSFQPITHLSESHRYFPKALLGNSLIYGGLLCLILPVSVAAFLVSENKKSFSAIVFLVCSLVIYFASLITWDVRIWLAAHLSLFVTSFIIKKRYFLFLALFLFLLFGANFQYNDTFRGNSVSTWSHYTQSKKNEDLNWEKNLQSISDNLWFGTGLKSAASNANSTGYENSFLKLLLQTGVLGSLCFGFFIISCIFNCLSLLREIPSTHIWHKVYMYSFLGSITAFLVLSLGTFAIGNFSILFLFLFLLSAQHHMMEAYGRGFVPDDHAI